MRYEKYKGGRFWAVYDDQNQLISVCVYKCGAIGLIKTILLLQGLDNKKVAEALHNIETAYKAQGNMA